MPYHISINLEAFVTDFGNVPVHNVRAECNDSAVESPLANCLDFDDYDYIYDDLSSGFGDIILYQMDCTTHAGLICEGIYKSCLGCTACMQP